MNLKSATSEMFTTGTEVWIIQKLINTQFYYWVLQFEDSSVFGSLPCMRFNAFITLFTPFYLKESIHVS